MTNIAPIDLSKLQISATAIESHADGAVIYAIAMARCERLNGLEVFARRKGARSIRFHAQRDAEAELMSPLTERRSRHALIIDAAPVASILGSAAAAVVIWAARIGPSDTAGRWLSGQLVATGLWIVWLIDSIAACAK